MTREKEEIIVLNWFIKWSLMDLQYLRRLLASGHLLFWFAGVSARLKVCQRTAGTTAVPAERIRIIAFAIVLRSEPANSGDSGLGLRASRWR